MITIPLPFFDSLEYIKRQAPPDHLSQTQKNDFLVSLNFLKSYTGSVGTFNSYRREVERLLQWCTLVSNKTLKQIKREDIEAFVRFCQKPKKYWIGTKKVPRFMGFTAYPGQTGNEKLKRYISIKASSRNF